MVDCVPLTRRPSDRVFNLLKREQPAISSRHGPRIIEELARRNINWRGARKAPGRYLEVCVVHRTGAFHELQWLGVRNSGDKNPAAAVPCAPQREGHRSRSELVEADERQGSRGFP